MRSTRSNKINLRECSDEEMMSLEGTAETGDETVAVVQIEASTDKNLLKKRMRQYSAMLRGMQLWYHAAHHVTRGTGFFGDHADLYGKLYEELTGDFDNAVEKAVGLTNDEEMACPICITKLASQVLEKFPSPVSLSSLAIASTALEMEKYHNELVTAIFHELEETGNLSLGLDDMLMATVNDHEGYIYKLQQRVKTELED